MLARKGRRRAPKEWRVTLQCMQRTVWMRVAMRRGDVVRLIIREDGSVGVFTYPSVGLLMDTSVR
jgi:hypothetical protein